MLLQVRRGAGVTNEEILGFAKLFNDELTLDNISRLILVFLFNASLIYIYLHSLWWMRFVSLQKICNS